MAQIRKLDPHVANLIAAGEVVERPASVAKELLENAIDAGATEITLEIVAGGTAMIRVTDNGSGILPEDIDTAFLRHATSKLAHEKDLEAIESLGFRGEALAAISAVSRLEVMSRCEGAELGIAQTMWAGERVERTEVASPQGTTMVVRDLFYNTPARMKFMKSSSAESSAVFSVVQKVALARPDIAMKFIREGKRELSTAGDGNLASVMYQIFGRDIALGLKEFSSEYDNISVKGFVSLPVCCRGSRGYQHFSLNGRTIRSRILTAAVEQAYENQKMVGKFPACVIDITMKSTAIDVNVHPAKTEVKFLRDKQVFDCVYYAVRGLLEGNAVRPTWQFAKEEEKAPAVAPQRKTEGFPQKVETLFPGKQSTVKIEEPVVKEVSQLGLSGYLAGKIPTKKEEVPKVEAPKKIVENPFAMPSETVGKFSFHSPEMGYNGKNALTIGGFSPKEEKPVGKTLPPVEAVKTTSPVAEESFSIVEEAPVAWRVVGEILHTYIIVEQGDSVFYIDKHAAHERMHFDAMKLAGYRPMSQGLLTPLLVHLSPEEKELLLERTALLKEFGFAVESFGGDCIAVREVPSDIALEEVEGFFAEISHDFRVGKHVELENIRDHMMHSMACKAAIKGGQKNDLLELNKVAEAVMSGAVKYCPHGRPVAITITRKELEKQFGRG